MSIICKLMGHNWWHYRRFNMHPISFKRIWDDFMVSDGFYVEDFDSIQERRACRRCIRREVLRNSPGKGYTGYAGGGTSEASIDKELIWVKVDG